MRLRQEFRTKHKTFRSQRAAVVLGWSLAAAASLFFVITWANWRLQRGGNITKQQSSFAQSASTSQTNANTSVQNLQSTTSEQGEVLVASNDSGEFTLLPDSTPAAAEDATVVRVQMQRAALGALGLPVSEEHAGDWIQVDLLVGDDGLPQAVRLPSTTQSTN